MSVRLVPRGAPDLRVDFGVSVLSMAVVALLGAALFALAGAPPLPALGVLVTEPFGSVYGLSEVALRAVPLAFCGLSVALALKVGLWNIGAEGQLYMGATAATWVALFAPSMPGFTGVWAVMLAGAVAGALWALVAGTLRVLFGVSEIISTLMLNYVAIAWVELLVYGPWKGADGFPYTALIADAWRLPLLVRRVHAGAIVVLVLAVGLWWAERRTILGYEVRVAGASPQAARAAGMPVRARLLLVFALAGAMAGLAGASEVAGVQHRLQAGLSPGYGYTAIIVAFLARRHLLATVGVAVVFGALAVGGDGLQVAFPGVSSAIVHAFEGGALLVALVGGVLARHRIQWEGAPWIR